METTQILSVFAMIFAITGSWLAVESRWTEAAKAFLLGNTMNIMVGLGIGDAGFVLAQASLAYFTLPLYKDRKFTAFLIAMALVLLATIGVSSGFYLAVEPVSATGGVLATIGAYAMAKGQYKLMGWMWIVADLLFLWVGIQHGLVGLIILSSVFIYHGILRVTGRKQTGLFTFTRS